MNNNKNLRVYNRKDVIVFRKTREIYGGLSNMAAGYPVCVNGIDIRTIEALYQACRYPSFPEIQKKIIKQKSPMTAKMVGKPYRKSTRSDWNNVRVNIMRWCLRIKLSQNWNNFGELLRSTDDKAIVEESYKDQFWGAKSFEDTLVGINALGRLLMELRREYIESLSTNEYTVKPLTIENFYLYNKPIESFKIKINSDNIKNETKYNLEKHKVNKGNQLNFYDK